MFTIGAFARLGLVSVRMLRHYDAVGLLQPARVDAATGYRFYEADQLATLNRVIALKDLGFTLEQVGTILDEKVSVEELHGMLRLRRTELAARIAADSAALTQVEARLRTIEREGRMHPDEIVTKQVAAVRVAELTGVAQSYGPQHIGPVVQPLYQQLMCALAEAGVTPVGHAIAYYEDTPDGIGVHAAVPVDVEPGGDGPFAIVDLPAIEAATAIHRGPMDDVLGTLDATARWIEENGYRTTGLHREVYLDTTGADQSDWVTEIQEPIVRA
jgi:DNA-binding transcriptional MerR regulator